MKFPRYILSLLLLLMLPSLVKAQKGVLFRIQKGNEKPSYVFGVLPLKSAELYNFSDSVYSILNHVDAIATEFIHDTVQQEQLKQMTAMQKMSLLDLYNNEQYGLVERQLLYKRKEFLQPYQDHWPLYLRHLLEQAQIASLGEQRSVEGFFLSVAREQGKQLESYFSPTEYVQFWERLPLPVQADALFNYVKDLQYHPQVWRQLQQHYLQGNMDRLTKYWAEQEHYQYFKEINRAKAAAVASKIQAMDDQRSVFFVVQASYLGGNNNIIQTLKQAGYKVQPINPGFLVPGSKDDNDLFKKDSIVYYELNADYDERYFDRLVPHWKEVVVHRGAFAVKMPEAPAVAIDKVAANDKMLTVNVYKYDNKAINTFYMVSYNDYPADFEPFYKRDFFRDVVSSVVRRMNGTLLIEKDISTKDYQGREIEIQLQDNYTIRGRFYLVGNRLYQVLMGGAEKRAYEPENEAFLKSFRLINQTNIDWYTLDLGAITIDLPEQPQYTAVTMADSFTSYNFSADHPVTGLEFLVSYTLLPQKGKQKNLPAFYNNLAYTAARETESIFIEDKIVEINNLSYKYLELGGKNDEVYRILFFKHNNKLYQLMVKGSSDAAYSGYADQFINSFAPGMHEY